MQIAQNQTTKRVCCLYRVSTKGQVDNDDIPMQKTACREFIAAQGWVLANEFSEKGVSGYKVSAHDRDAIQEIQRDALAGKFDVLLVFMFDRLGRRDDETPFIVEWFVKQGIEVWSTQEGQQKIECHTDKLLNYIRYWQASGESLKTSQRIKTKFEQMTQEGVYTGRAAPYGYRLVHKGRMGKKNRELLDLEVDEEEAVLVRQIFDKTANEGYGSHRLAEWVNQQGIRTHNGSKWQCNTILRILKNELYTGRFVSGEVRSDVIPDLRIIDDALFARTQVIVAQRNKNWTEKQEQSAAFQMSEYLLAGKLYCADCGGRLTATTHTDRYKKQDDNVSVNKTRRYVCYHNTRSLRVCNGQSSYKADKVEAAVMEALQELFEQIQASPQEQLLESKYRKQQRAGRDALRRHEKNLEKLQRDLDCLKAEVVNALTGNGKFSAELLSGLITEKETLIRQESAEAQALSAEMNNRQAAIKSMSGQFTQFEGWAQEFALCSKERKQMIILHLIDRIEIDRDYEITIRFNTVYDGFIGQASVAA